MSATTENIEDLVRASVRAEIDDLRRFLDRRISELSMEIHATVQLVDYSETNLSAKLASIHEQIARVVAPPVAATYNSGVELEAVVQATEAPPTRSWEQPKPSPAGCRRGRSRRAAGGDAAGQRIFEACTFQDLTGQRIRRAIERLQQVESMLLGMIHDVPTEQPAAPAAPDLVQTDIDSMFA
jgi:chemotaxis protein CheZ